MRVRVMTRRWYGDRLAPGDEPATIDTLQGYLTDIGLTAPFWQLRP